MAPGGLASVRTSTNPVPFKSVSTWPGAIRQPPQSTVRSRTRDGLTGSVPGLAIANRSHPPGRNAWYTCSQAAGITVSGMKALGIQARSKASVSERSSSACSRNRMRSVRPSAPVRSREREPGTAPRDRYRQFRDGQRCAIATDRPAIAHTRRQETTHFRPECCESPSRCGTIVCVNASAKPAETSPPTCKISVSVWVHDKERVE